MNIKIITKISIIVSIISILSVVSIPLPLPSNIPLTLQTFSISFAGFYLGKKYGSFATIIYILIGVIGLPVFSGMQGGIGRLFVPSGGFILGFVFISFFSGISLKCSFIGLFICHLFGIIQFSIKTNTPIILSIITVSLPFILKDILSILLAYIVSKRIKSYTI